MGDELLDFAEFINERRRLLGSLDFERKLRAQCVVDLWEVIREDRGEEAFADWVIRIIAQGENHQSFPASPNVNFMSLHAEELDDWVPVMVVQRWARQFVRAYSSLFRELGLEPPKGSIQD